MASIGPDLLHDAEVRVELLGDELLRGELSLVVLALLEVHPPGQIVVVGLDRRATGGDLREAGPSGSGPARLVGPCRPLVRRRPLVAHVDRRRCPLEHVLRLPTCHLGQLGMACTAVAPVPMMPTRALERDVVVPAGRGTRRPGTSPSRRRASFGLVRIPLARITNRARMASPRSVDTVQRRVASSQAVCSTVV